MQSKIFKKKIEQSLFFFSWLQCIVKFDKINIGGGVMIEIISIGVPALLAVGICEKIEKKELKTKQFIFHYVSFLIVMLLLNEIALTYLFHNGEYMLSGNAFTNAFTVKYLVLSMVEMFVLPYLYVLMKKNIEIKLEVGRENEKKRDS